MRAEHVRDYKAVHTWTGIVSGMALFIAFYAGAFTVFKEPLRHWATPPAERLQAVPMDETHALLSAALASVPGGARVVLALEGDHAIPRVEWQLRDRRADDHDETRTRHFSATLAADGGLRVTEERPSRLVEFVDVLHRVVGLPVDTDVNRWIMGVIAALYFVALVSGLVVLLPSLARDLFALRTGRNLKRMWLDAHNAVGVVSLPFHIVMALSSVVFAFHDPIYAVHDRVLHEGRWSQPSARRTPGEGPARNPADMLKPSELVRVAKAASPGFMPTSLQYAQPAGPRPIVRIWGRHPEGVSPRARGGFAAIDPYTGEILSSDYLSGAQDTPNLFISSFFALHMASFGGAIVPWLYFLLGLAGAWLFYSGNLLWVETRRKQRRRGGEMPAQRRDAAIMAAATVGVCLGCVAGLSATIAAAKWLPGRVEDMAAWHVGIYYGAFFASVAWAFSRGAARAAAPLLWTSAACTLAIPASSLAGWLLPSSRAWLDPSAWAVDLTALAGALVLACMARATARRVREGAPDSVWSLPAGAKAARG
jgi:uncharacterized iron-regulated membrane protein